MLMKLNCATCIEECEFAGKDIEPTDASCYVGPYDDEDFSLDEVPLLRKRIGGLEERIVKLESSRCEECDVRRFVMDMKAAMARAQG